jgi:probable phosphoglycerate mutase
MQICWLVRHGQSASNAGTLTIDAGSTPLTPLGKVQAERFAEEFTAVPDLIVTSPYTRARQTAIPFSQRFPSVPLETWPVQEFSGLAPSRYEQTDQYVRRQWIYAFWAELDPDFVDGPGAESFAVGLQRVHDFLTRLRQHPAERIVVFTHGRFLQLVLWVWLVQDLAKAKAHKDRCHAFFQTIPVPNTAVINGRVFDNQLLLSPPHNGHLPPELHS